MKELNVQIVFSLITLVVLLAGCKEQVHTIAEFKANKALREQYLAKCKNGEIDDESLNCKNVSKAASQIASQIEFKR